MIWEIAEDIKRYVRTTVIPSIKNLFSSKRGLIGLFLVMLIIQMLLCVICVTGIENIAIQKEVLEEFKVSLASEDSLITDASGTYITSDEFKAAFSSTAIFIGALILWGICALTVYKKITFASADRDKYIWGMLITHGAKKKKIKAMLRCELYLPQLAATVIAYPASIILCNIALRDLGYSYSSSLIKLLAVLALSYVCIRLVVEYQCFLIRSMSCTEMLRDEDSPKSVCYPSKNARLVKGFTPFRYGTSAFFRMRKYYISLALLAAVPALIWICLNVCIAGEDGFLATTINEFSISASSGISEEDLKKLQQDDIGDIEGVDSVESFAHYESSKIYTHLLADKSKFSTIVDSPYYADIYADNELKLTCNDRAFKQFVGLNISYIRDGTAVIVAPNDDVRYNFKEGDRIFVAVSKNDGSVRTLKADDLSVLKNDLSSSYDYVELRVAAVQCTNRKSLSASGFLNVTDNYVVLSDNDYEKVTSISASHYKSSIGLDQVTVDTSLDNAASFNISIPRHLLGNMPKAGDCIGLTGKYNLTFSLTTLPKSESEKPEEYKNKIASGGFDYAYINSVNSSGDTVTLNVSPYDMIILERISGTKYISALVMGAPPIESGVNSYFINTYDKATINNGTVEIKGETIAVYTSSVVTAAKAGTHAILPSTALTTTDGKLFLETLHADNSFDIACGDKTTLEHLGLDIDTVKETDAVLVLPNDSSHHFDFAIGDKLRLATTLEDVALYSADSTTSSGRYDTLVEHLKLNTYTYTTVYVTEIIYSDDIDSPTVIVSSESFCKVTDKDAPYVNIAVYLDADTDSKGYADICKEINDWLKPKQSKFKVISTGEYIDHLLRKTANYATIIMLISALVPLIIPFIWYYPLSSLFDRRRTELYVLHALGKKKRTVRACFFFEGLEVTLAAFASVFLLCYPAMFVFKLICNYFKLPLEFDYSYLTLPVLLTAAALSAVCAAAAFALCFATTRYTRKTRKPRKKYADT